MICHTYGGASSLVRGLSIFTYYYLAYQLAVIGVILLYIGLRSRIKGKVGTAT